MMGELHDAQLERNYRQNCAIHCACTNIILSDCSPKESLPHHLHDKWLGRLLNEMLNENWKPKGYSIRSSIRGCGDVL
jgi:hypothetical protein